MQFFKTTHFDFIGKRRIAYMISSALIILCLFSLLIRGGLNYGIDFKGGMSVVLKFKQDITISELRAAMASSDLGNIEIKRFGSKDEILIYVQQQKALSAQEMENKVDDAIKNALPGYEYERLQFDTVGPKVGAELRGKAVMAILISLLCILIYIGWRFELIFAVGAIVALFHDVISTLGIFNLINYELSLKEIAAFLTIVGYSLNDTIVVYDRIRENLKVMRSENLATIINTSINQTLNRTIMTSLTTFIVVFILFMIGGSVLRGFAFAMTIGVIVGTYSSIFVASSLVLEWQSRHGDKGKLRMMKRKK